MNILNLENVTKIWGNREILSGTSLGVQDTDKIGLIGVNGAGKSTILSIVAGETEVDEGGVVRSNTLKISYLTQTPYFDEKKTVLENVVDKIYGKEAHWDVTGEAKAMLLRFGITNPDGYPDTLSGGQKKRAALAATLLTPANLMILDEPTNHLDMPMIEYLQDFLQNYSGAIILVTHDRYFLDQVTNKIVEIDKAKLYQYETNYSGYLELREQRIESQKATERKMAALYKKDLAWIMRGARARSTKQKAHIERFERLRDREKIIEDRDVKMQSMASRIGKKTIECEGISKGFSEKKLFQDFTYIFGRMDRVGIVGANGCGKSTLVKIITGNLEPDTGTVEIGPTVKIGYFSQENDALPKTGRVIDAVTDIATRIETKDGYLTASKMCETFLFDGNMQYTPVEKLSGGEKRRLFLLRILMSAPNVLILDEPTNDLDIHSLRVLEDYLDEFPGIVITISHDRYFLDRVVNRIFSFEPDGTIKQSEGGYEDYRQRGFASSEISYVNQEKQSKSSQDTDLKAKDWKDRTKKKLSYNEQREFDGIEEEIASLEEKLDLIEKEMLANANSYIKLGELTEEKTKLEAVLEEKMERFIYLQDLVDSFAKEY